MGAAASSYTRREVTYGESGESIWGDGQRVVGDFGVLWAVYGVLMIAAAAFLIVYEGTLTVMWGAILTRVANPFAWMSAFHLFLVATVVMALISAALSLLAAMALMRGAASSRKFGLAAAVFGMLGTPPGVALGVFTVAVLFPGD